MSIKKSVKRAMDGHTSALDILARDVGVLAASRNVTDIDEGRKCLSALLQIREIRPGTHIVARALLEVLHGARNQTIYEDEMELRRVIREERLAALGFECVSEERREANIKDNVDLLDPLDPENGR